MWMKARLWNSSIGKYMYFDYEKVEEADKAPLTKEQLEAIKKFKEETDKFYEKD